MKTEKIVVEVSVGNTKFPGDGEKKVYETAQDVLADLQTDAKSIIDHINYSLDLEERARVRAKVLADPKVAGVAAYEKNVKEFMKTRAANGKPVTEEVARKMLDMLATLDPSAVS